MIKAKLKAKGKDVYLVGLSEGNIKRLKKGEPIHITDKGFPEIVIMYGKTEQAILNELNTTYDLSNANIHKNNSEH